MEGVVFWGFSDDKWDAAAVPFETTTASISGRSLVPNVTL